MSRAGGRQHQQGFALGGMVRNQALCIHESVDQVELEHALHGLSATPLSGARPGETGAQPSPVLLMVTGRRVTRCGTISVSPSTGDNYIFVLVTDTVNRFRGYLCVCFAGSASMNVSILYDLWKRMDCHSLTPTANYRV